MVEKQAIFEIIWSFLLLNTSLSSCASIPQGVTGKDFFFSCPKFSYFLKPNLSPGS